MFLKGFVTAVIIGLSLTSATIVFAQSDLTMTLDGQVINSDVPPFIENDRTMVPVRFISEAFGAEVSWDEDARLVTIAKGLGVEIQLTIGSHTMELIHTMRAEYISLPDGYTFENNRIHPLGSDVAAVIRDGRTFVPVRVIADALGKLTTWDDESRTVIFTTLVLDDFPEGFVYVEQYQFTGDYGAGLSPREAALKLLSNHMLIRQLQEHNARLEGLVPELPIPVSITLIDSVLWQGVYFYDFHFGLDWPDYGISDHAFRVSLDGAFYSPAGRGAWMRFFLNFE